VFEGVGGVGGSGGACPYAGKAGVGIGGVTEQFGEAKKMNGKSF